MQCYSSQTTNAAGVSSMHVCLCGITSIYSQSKEIKTWPAFQQYLEAMNPPSVMARNAIIINFHKPHVFNGTYILPFMVNYYCKFSAFVHSFLVWWLAESSKRQENAGLGARLFHGEWGLSAITSCGQVANCKQHISDTREPTPPIHCNLSELPPPVSPASELASPNMICHNELFIQCNAFPKLPPLSCIYVLWQEDVDVSKQDYCDGSACHTDPRVVIHMLL